MMLPLIKIYGFNAARGYGSREAAFGPTITVKSSGSFLRSEAVDPDNLPTITGALKSVLDEVMERGLPVEIAVCAQANENPDNRVDHKFLVPPGSRPFFAFRALDAHGLSMDNGIATLPEGVMVTSARVYPAHHARQLTPRLKLPERANDKGSHVAFVTFGRASTGEVDRLAALQAFVSVGEMQRIRLLPTMAARHE